MSFDVSSVQARRPGVRSLGVMVVSELKMVVRDVSGLVVPLVLPLLILVMSASAATAEVDEASGLSGLEVYVLPIVIAIVFSLIGVVNMPSFIAYYRKAGVLRRLAVTPASPSMVLVAQVVVSLIQAAIGVGVALLVAVTFFEASLPGNLLAFVGVMLLGLLAMYGIGMVVAAVAPSPSGAVAIALIVFFALGATGGMFGGRDALPDTVATIGEHLPFGALVEALGDLWLRGSVEPVHLIAMAAAAVLGGAIAALTFRWD